MWKVCIQKQVIYFTSNVENVWQDKMTKYGSVNGIS